MGARGTAILDFGADPALAEEAAVTVSGQAGYVVTSAAEAFFMSEATAFNDAETHEEAAVCAPLVCKYIADGSFEIRAKLIELLGTGTFNVRWVWD